MNPTIAILSPLEILQEQFHVAHEEFGLVINRCHIGKEPGHIHTPHENEAMKIAGLKMDEARTRFLEAGGSLGDCKGWSL
jgi:hypothetical protein